MKYREIGKYKYQLAERLIHKVGLPDAIGLSGDFVRIENSELILRKYYAWDGSTVPMKKWLKIVGWKSDKFCKKASVIHDALYQLMRAGLLDKDYKDIADQLYRGLCVKGGMSKWQANLRYWALNKFGSLKYKAMTPEIFEV